jgi:hypothetical protein
MRLFLPFAFAMGAALPAALLHAQDDDPIEDARAAYRRDHPLRIEADGRACAARGGIYEYRAMGMAPFCVMRTANADRSCSSKSQCEGLCVAVAEPEGGRMVRPGQPVAGRCSAEREPFGCYAQVEAGKATGTFCAD